MDLDFDRMKWPQIPTMCIPVFTQRVEQILPDHSTYVRTGRPRHRLERFQSILDWFGRYLR